MEKTEWQKRREEEDRTDRNIRFCICGLIAIGAALLHFYWTVPAVQP